MGKLVDSILSKIPKGADKGGGPLSDIAGKIGGGLSYAGGKIVEGVSYAAEATSDFVKADGLNPMGFLYNYAVGAAQEDSSVTNVVDTAQKGQEATTQAVVDTGEALQSAGQTVVNTISGGIDTVKKVLPFVAVGGLGLLLLSRKR